MMIRGSIRILFPLCLSLLILAGVVVFNSAAQLLVCSTLPLVGPVQDLRGLPPLKNLDPCTHQLTMSEDALKHSGGLYLSKAEVEKSATEHMKPTKVRSYFVTYEQYLKMMNRQVASTTVYPDKEVWLVVVQAPDQGPVPSIPHGMEPWPRRYFFQVFDATTGKVLELGGNGPNEGDWPASLPAD